MKCIISQLEDTSTVFFAELEPWEKDQLTVLCPEHCRPPDQT